MQKAHLEKSDVVAVYAKLAPRYDLWSELAESKARRRCLELAQIRNGEAVLEVAVGTGTAFVEILSRNRDGINEGIDLTEPMLAHARRKAEETGATNFRLQVGDAIDLPFQDDTFHVLVNNYMFDLMPEEDFPQVLAEFRRVLRPGGRLVVANMTMPEHWSQSLWERLYRLSPSLMGGCRGVELMPFLESAGLIDLRREFVGQLTFPSEVLFGVKPG